MLAKRQYYHTAFNTHSNNLKKTWKIINEVLNRNNKKHNLPLSFKSKNGALITNEKEIANSFNDYFINICNDTKKSENKSYSYSAYLKNKPNSNLSFNEVTIHTVLSIIDSLKPKTSSGMDEISNKTLKALKNEIAAPLTVIINQMLYTGIFPDALKISKVIPLYKKDDKQLFSNY